MTDNVSPGAADNNEFCDRTPILLLIDRIHRPQLRQQVVPLL
jgi:hypothetical protein